MYHKLGELVFDRDSKNLRDLLINICMAMQSRLCHDFATHVWDTPPRAQACAHFETPNLERIKTLHSLDEEIRQANVSGSASPRSSSLVPTRVVTHYDARIRRNGSSAERSHSLEAGRASSHQPRHHDMFVNDDDTPDAQYAVDDADATDEIPLSRSRSTSAAAFDR